MIPVTRQKNPGRNSYSAQMLSVGFGIATILGFVAPLLSGSNHTCPVLRRQDLEKGPASVRAMPAFARKYNVDCTYCHTAWPQLNRTGIIFRYHGYRMPWEVPATSGGAPPGATSPVPPAITSGLQKAATKEAIAEGQSVFTRMQCFTCHANGENLVDPSKPIKGPDFLKKFPDDAQIAKIVRNGVAGTAMPAYGKDRLSDVQLVSLIAYIRSLTPQQ